MSTSFFFLVYISHLLSEHYKFKNGQDTSLIPRLRRSIHLSLAFEAVVVLICAMSILFPDLMEETVSLTTVLLSVFPTLLLDLFEQTKQMALVGTRRDRYKKREVPALEDVDDQVALQDVKLSQTKMIHYIQTPVQSL